MYDPINYTQSRRWTSPPATSCSSQTPTRSWGRGWCRSSRTLTWRRRGRRSGTSSTSPRRCSASSTLSGGNNKYIYIHCQEVTSNNKPFIFGWREWESLIFGCLIILIELNKHCKLVCCVAWTKVSKPDFCHEYRTRRGNTSQNIELSINNEFI